MAPGLELGFPAISVYLQSFFLLIRHTFCRLQGRDDEAEHHKEWQPYLQHAQEVILNVGLVRHLLHVEVEAVQGSGARLDVNYGTTHAVLEGQEAGHIVILLKEELTMSNFKLK